MDEAGCESLEVRHCRDGCFGHSGRLQKPHSVVAFEKDEAAPGGNALPGFFSGMFGGSESKPAPPPPAEEAPQSGQPAPVQSAPAQASEQPASALSVTSAPGGVLIVFGSASSEASGRATAKNIKAQLSDILINRQLDVTPRGNGGFQIQAGPYNAKSSAVAICSAIKQRGIPCQVTP